jgi:hypothetical protein
MNFSILDNFNITFTDESSRTEASKVRCFISVKENKQKTCYVLDYSWVIILGDSSFSNNEAYPFIQNQHDDTDCEGVIVSKNEMTTHMIRHLVMPETELKMLCGMGTTSDYRAKIIRALATLWD